MQVFIVMLIVVFIGLFCSVDDSSKAHRQEWLDQQSPAAGPKIYPGTFDLGEIVGCLVLAIIVLVVVAQL